MRKIFLAILIIIAILDADEVSNWCGYNTGLISKLNESGRDGFWYKYNPSYTIIPASVFNEKDIIFIRNLYAMYNFDKDRIYNEFINGYKKNTGPFNDFIKKVIPHLFVGDSYKNIAYELVYGKVIKYTKKIRENINEMDNFFFWWEGRSEKDPKYVYFINPKFLLANLDAAKEGRVVTEAQVVSATFGDGPNHGYNPCNKQK